MAKFFHIEAKNLPLLNELMERGNDNEFIVLSVYNNIVDIAQYSQKYGNIHFVSVPHDRLDFKYRIA